MFLQDLLHSMHGIEVPIKTIQGSLYVRISAHIYNTLEEYAKLGDAIQQMQQMQMQQQQQQQQ
jgi:selenocysteine lyase/cysteine desulfurase